MIFCLVSGPRPERRLLGPGNPHVRAADRNAPLHQLGAHEDVQHDPQGHQHDRVPGKDNRPKSQGADQAAVPRRARREAGLPERRHEGGAEAQVVRGLRLGGAQVQDDGTPHRAQDQGPPGHEQLRQLSKGHHRDAGRDLGMGRKVLDSDRRMCVQFLGCFRSDLTRSLLY